jgi:hypothetical protein
MRPAPTRWITPMRRREFITLAGGMAAWPLSALAQQRTRTVPVIGFLHPGLSDGSSVTYAALIDGLREIGYVDGETMLSSARLICFPRQTTSYRYPIILNGVLFQLKSGLTSAPRLPQAPKTERGSMWDRRRSSGSWRRGCNSQPRRNHVLLLSVAALSRFL